MLKYLRKYYILYYLISIIPALIYLAVAYFSQGMNAFLSLWTWGTVILLVVACAFFAGRVLNRVAVEEIRKMIYLFYQKCDPEGFIAKSSEVVGRIKAPFDEWASMLMGAYSLANIDVGNTEAAKVTVEGMRVSAKAAKGKSVARICLNMHAAIKALYGPDLALKCLGEAKWSLRSLEMDQDIIEEFQMIDQEQELDIAEKLQDDSKIIEINTKVFNNEKLLLRIRVLAAYQIALAYDRLGNEEQARHFYGYVLENGNKLGVVARANDRLNEMGTPQLSS